MNKYLILFAAIAAPVIARTSSEKAAAMAETAIERAYLRANGAEVAAALKPLDAALVSDPHNSALLYERAFGSYAAGTALRAAKDNDAIEAEYDHAMALLDRVRGQPWQAEADALHSSILGALIGIKGGMSGMTLGPKSGEYMERAAKVLPQSPRVLLFRGTALLNTPTAYGGDPAKALQLLQRSVDAFAAVDSKAPGPHWGRVDALTWLGIAKQKAGDTAGARSAWEQALALEPNDAWVKFALLPSLPQKSAP